MPVVNARMDGAIPHPRHEASERGSVLLVAVLIRPSSSLLPGDGGQRILLDAPKSAAISRHSLFRRLRGGTGISTL